MRHVRFLLPALCRCAGERLPSGGGLRKLDARTYSVEFPTAACLPYLTAAGRHAFWLGVYDAAGRAFAASTIVEVRGI